jgi:hypothetical protein
LSTNGAFARQTEPVESEHAMTFCAITVPPARLDQLYPLAQLARPALSIEQWRRIAADAGPGGRAALIAVEGPNGQFYGLGLCSVQGDSLVVDPVVAVHPMFPDRVLSELIGAAELAAIERRAKQLVLRIPVGPVATSGQTMLASRREESAFG